MLSFKKHILLTMIGFISLSLPLQSFAQKEKKLTRVLFIFDFENHQKCFSRHIMELLHLDFPEGYVVIEIQNQRSNKRLI